MGELFIVLSDDVEPMIFTSSRIDNVENVFSSQRKILCNTFRRT